MPGDGGRVGGLVELEVLGVVLLLLLLLGVVLGHGGRGRGDEDARSVGAMSCAASLQGGSCELRCWYVGSSIPADVFISRQILEMPIRLGLRGLGAECWLFGRGWRFLEASLRSRFTNWLHDIRRGRKLLWHLTGFLWSTGQLRQGFLATNKSLNAGNDNRKQGPPLSVFSNRGL